jgi:AraC family transcriptional regulator of adaptative response / DNA-3-methyladenine glycosylase II
LFAKHVGASPLAVAHTQRLHFAKQLIDQTTLPMTCVAEAAGYGSVRRFNDTFKKTYGRTPRQLRRHDDEPARDNSVLTVRLPCRQPFDWEMLLAFFSARAIPGVEQVVDGAYFRSVEFDGRTGVIECRLERPGHVALKLHGIATPHLFSVVQRVRDLFDLEAPIAEIAAALGPDGLLDRMLQSHPGIRVPGAWDGFELSVRAILGQQVSVKAATTLAGRIAKRYGARLELPLSLAGRDSLPELCRTFPKPEQLALARINDMGIVGSRAEAIRQLARAVVAGTVDFDAGQDPVEVCQRLTALRGIGDWTAQYVAMRGLKCPDAFPVTDLGLLKAAGVSGRKGVADLQRRAEAWRPWRAYAALLLWSSLPNSGG